MDIKIKVLENIGYDSRRSFGVVGTTYKLTMIGANYILKDLEGYSWHLDSSDVENNECTVATASFKTKFEVVRGDTSLKESKKNAFEIVDDFLDCNIDIPRRATKGSAGYDIKAAEDIVVPSIFSVFKNAFYFETLRLNESAKKNKSIEDCATLVPTGLSIKLEKDKCMNLLVRSSIGVKNLLIMPNGYGLIDSDYYPNQFYVPLINLSRHDILIKKGDRIAQGVISQYYMTDDDECEEERNGGIGSTGM